MNSKPLSQLTICIKSAGEMATGEEGYCFTVSQKERAVGGAVLEAILAHYNQ